MNTSKPTSIESNQWQAYFRECNTRFIQYWVAQTVENYANYPSLTGDLDNILTALTLAEENGLNNKFVEGTLAAYYLLESGENDVK